MIDDVQFSIHFIFSINFFLTSLLLILFHFIQLGILHGGGNPVAVL